MPNAEARAIFAETETLLDALRDIEVRERALVDRLRTAASVVEIDDAYSGIEALRSVWSDFFGQYCQAVDRYAAAVRTAALSRERVVGGV